MNIEEFLIEEFSNRFPDTNFNIVHDDSKYTKESGKYDIKLNINNEVLFFSDEFDDFTNHVANILIPQGYLNFGFTLDFWSRYQSSDMPEHCVQLVNEVFLSTDDGEQRKYQIFPVEKIETIGRMYQFIFNLDNMYNSMSDIEKNALLYIVEERLYSTNQNLDSRVEIENNILEVA